MKLTIENKMIERLLTSHDSSAAILGALLIDDVAVPLYLASLKEHDRMLFRLENPVYPCAGEIWKVVGMRSGAMPYYSARLDYIKYYYATNNLG